mmetsp:Transcript_89842/g.290776  ORF Transcript_89842/g.290776 Transcript_89842/m.290776 type:complete len:288 (+) Transcript_89842:56-919(+)
MHAALPPQPQGLVPRAALRLVTPPVFHGQQWAGLTLQAAGLCPPTAIPRLARVPSRDQQQHQHVADHLRRGRKPPCRCNLDVLVRSQEGRSSEIVNDHLHEAIHHESQHEDHLEDGLRDIDGLRLPQVDPRCAGPAQLRLPKLQPAAAVVRGLVRMQAVFALAQPLLRWLGLQLWRQRPVQGLRYGLHRRRLCVPLLLPEAPCLVAATSAEGGRAEGAHLRRILHTKQVHQRCEIPAVQHWLGTYPTGKEQQLDQFRVHATQAYCHGAILLLGHLVTRLRSGKGCNA